MSYSIEQRNLYYWPGGCSVPVKKVVCSLKKENTSEEERLQVFFFYSCVESLYLHKGMGYIFAK